MKYRIFSRITRTENTKKFEAEVGLRVIHWLALPQCSGISF